MRSESLRVWRLVLVVTVLGVVLWVNAGDLNPPPGPVEPTMVTLQEISGQVQAVSDQVDNLTPPDCCQPVWEYQWLSVNSGDTDVLAVCGSGVLHGVWVSGAGGGAGSGAHSNVLITDGAGPEGKSIIRIDRGIQTSGVWQNDFFELDVPFASGLYVTNYETATAGVNLTFIYRSSS